MKSNFIPKLFLVAVASMMLFACSNDDDQVVAQKSQTVSPLLSKGQDSTFVSLPGEPMIPKPKG